MGSGADAQRVTESRGDDFEVVYAFGVGLLVDAIERRDTLVFEVLCDALVGREHEFFNQAVRDFALRAGDALHQSKFVEFNHRLRQIEVDGTATLAFAVQNESEIPHQFEYRDQCRHSASARRRRPRAPR